MPIGYGVIAQKVPPLTVYGDIPIFHFNSRFGLRMYYKYFWNNKIVILADYYVYEDEAAEQDNNYSKVHML